MPETNSSRSGALIGKWVWLFPATYLLHIAEEYWGGEGFYRWISRFTGAELAPEQFLTLNATAWIFMVVGIAIMLWTNSWRWLLVAFGTVVLLNGLAHTVGSLITRSYSPGLLSGLFCWVPLGIVTLLRAWKSAPPSIFITGVIVGIGIHAVVSLLALQSLQEF